MTEFVLVRHGETTWHATNRYAGRTDVPLTEHGHHQARRLGRWAATAGLTALHTSPLTRCRDTGAPAATATGLPPHTDDRLIEIDFGQGEGLTAADMTARFPHIRTAFEENPVDNHFPDGEHPTDAAHRAAACLTELATIHPDGRILVISHSTLLRLLVCHLLDLPLRHYRRVFPAVGNCALTTLRWDGSRRPAALIELNRPVEESA
ncbi:histidine phosphatase family protein [Actinophytocola xinjiangensis]|uniref:Histidine phosphatase family protein n=1 Tax=Actinophytocola xinjiangensis TaxID=485602 RepID=A0A7Z0WRS5_9PSEU|nr:histidine phosphatase family protein [Actinophytocola xinjiangensis]OLF14146.1 histidine phosphatase family protein [Actinophytocola xinjiangensis]